MRRATVVVGLGALLCGCDPGALVHPERFYRDGGLDAGSGDGGLDCSNVEQTIFIPKCAGSGCHENPAAANNLDLVSPGVGARIVAATSTCMGKPMTVNLLDKLSAMPACGQPMPFGAPALLSAAEVLCVQKYLAALGDGGTP